MADAQPCRTPCFSVVIACYNNAGTVGNAIASVRAQTLTDWEVIVADDGSIDDSANIVADIAAEDRRVRLLRSDSNAGPSHARNRAIDQAQGTWIAILDADDCWNPRRLESLARLLDEHDDADIVADNLLLIDPADPDNPRPALKLDAARSFGLKEVIDSELSLWDFRLGYLKPAFRRSFLRHRDLRYDERFRHSEDFLLLAEALLRGARATLSPFAGYSYKLPGSESRKRSHQGERSYDPDQRVRIGDHLLHRYGTTVDPATKKLLQRYARKMEKIAAGHKAVAAIRRRSPGAAAQLARTPPAALLAYLLTTPTVKRLVRKARRSRHL